MTIIQARTNSSRLPGKALLPIAGYTTANLAGLRAANKGRQTIFATSDQSSDDELAQHAQRQGLTVFRGPLEDVLGRYYLAASGLSADSAVVRLTADNVFPDGDFVDELTKAFADAGADYLSVDSCQSGLPYGLAGEIFSVSALRHAYRDAVDDYDREHVGSWIRRNCKVGTYCPDCLDGIDLSHLRCTIDDQDDYERVVRCFATVADPVSVSWKDLCLTLAALADEPEFRIPDRVINGTPHSRMTLGTAQLGMAYGIVNDVGQPSVEQSIAMIRKAIAHGVTSLDTARSYGTAEAVIGEALQGSRSSRCAVVTKLNLSGLRADASENEVRAHIDNEVACSCQALQRERLPVMLLHRWSDYSAWNGAAWKRILELRELGNIGQLGVSVYDVEEALSALQDENLLHLQIPMNVMDWRWQAGGFDRGAAARPDVIVYARSPLLQGILVHPASRWPKCPGVDADQYSTILQGLTREFQRESVVDLCLAYVRSLPWIASVIVGCETAGQLEENMRLFCRPELTAPQCAQLRDALPRAPEYFLNPSKWRSFET